MPFLNIFLPAMALAVDLQPPVDPRPLRITQIQKDAGVTKYEEELPKWKKDEMDKQIERDNDEMKEGIQRARKAMEQLMQQRRRPEEKMKEKFEMHTKRHNEIVQSSSGFSRKTIIPSKISASLEISIEEEDEEDGIEE